MLNDTASRTDERREIYGWSIRWNEGRAQEAYRGGWWQRHAMGIDAARLAEKEPDRVLLDDGAGTLTAQTLFRSACKLADYFHHAGLNPGDLVAFMLPNWREAAIIYLAATMRGLAVCPIIMAYGEGELRHIMADSGCRTLFVAASYRDRDYAALAEKATAGLPCPPELVSVRSAGGQGDVPSLEELLGADYPPAPPFEVDPDSVKVVIYTSGTTGRPKAVMHSHNSLHATVRQVRDYWQAGPDDCFLVPSPIGHIGGSIYSFEYPILYRTKAVLQDVWDAGAAIELINRHGCTHMAGATPFLDQLLQAARTRRDRLPSLRLFICGGASVPPPLIRDAAQFFAQCHATRVYGSSEVPLTTVGWLDRTHPDAAADSDGRIGIATVRLVEGEILARGPQMLVGYKDRLDEEQAFTPDGYFRTGDLGELLPGNVLKITGRKKDIIIRNGENISPREVEDILVKHPGVAELCVVGMPDPRVGERVVAVAVRADTTTIAPDLGELTDLLKRSGIAQFKYPEQLFWLSDLPRNATGKILKHEVKGLLANMRGEA